MVGSVGTGFVMNGAVVEAGTTRVGDGPGQENPGVSASGDLFGRANPMITGGTTIGGDPENSGNRNPAVVAGTGLRLTEADGETSGGVTHTGESFNTPEPAAGFGSGSTTPR